MTEAIYVLCAVTSLVCAVLLFRGWRASRHRLLLWSALCFAVLAVNNAIMVLDFLVLPSSNLTMYRHFTAHAALGLMLWGLVWEGS